MNASCALHHFCDLHGPQILLCTDTKTHIQDLNDNDNEDLKTFYSQYIKSEQPQGKAECKSCTLSSDSILVSTIDTPNHMIYISSPSTPNQELFKNIRNSCVRSLNVEKSVESDAPILYGNDEDGYCLSLTFSCKDFHARGSQRLYSLCYLCPNKYLLISLITLLTNCMRQVVYWLQYDANETYEQEGRIKINTNLNGITAATATYVFRTPPRAPSQRMLSDIVHDSKITFRIHALFVWILRTANSAIKESLYDALPTEEQTTKQERKDIFDEDDENAISRHRTTTVISKSMTNRTQDSLLISSTLTNNTHNPSYLASSIYSTTDSYHQNENGFNGIDDDDFDSLQYQFSSYGYEAFKLFELFIKKLNNTKYLQHILHNWVIGNRLIIKYTNRIDNKDLIRALASLFRLFLPDGCFQLIEATNQRTSCTANLILFDTDLVLTNEIFSSIIEDSNNNNKTIIIKIILDDIDDYLRVVKLETLPPTKSDIRVPTYVQTIIDLLTDDKLNEDVFEAIIMQHKIKYLNKAKLYFQYGRCLTGTTSLPNEREQMKIFNVQNTSVLLMIRFWQKGLSEAYKRQIRSWKRDNNQQHQ